MPLSWRTPAKESAIIERMTFDAARGRMLVKFARSPKIYAYPKANAAEMAGLLEAESTGKAFNVWKAGKEFYTIDSEDQDGPEASK